MKARTMVVPVVAIGFAWASVSGASAGAAPSKAKADTKVTIKAEGTDLSGRVVSPRPARCAQDRMVLVIKQKGARGGGDDVRFASDTADLNGDDYEWNTGTTGTEGRFYAKVKPTTRCKGDTSPTIRAVRDN